MEVVVGIVFLLLLAFAVWVWLDAVTVPADHWNKVATTTTPNFSKKGAWFFAWYAFGLISFGLITIAMAIHYFVQLRPLLRPETADKPQRPFAVPSRSNGIPEQIQQLADLHNRGVLTQDEFDAKKAELLARI